VVKADNKMTGATAKKYTFNIPIGAILHMPGMHGYPPIPPSSVPVEEHLLQAAKAIQAPVKRPQKGATIWEVITLTEEDDQVFQWPLREIRQYLVSCCEIRKPR
jgi:hypothetical protein